LALVCDWSRVSAGKFWSVQDDQMGSLVGTPSVSSTDRRSRVYAVDGHLVPGTMAATDRYCLRGILVRADVLRFSNLSTGP